tara:strand:- start:1484 stop:1597 length:114 start_codon:yes stop_codon:yes gene_type:complete
MHLEKVKQLGESGTEVSLTLFNVTAMGIEESGLKLAG